MRRFNLFVWLAVLLLTIGIARANESLTQEVLRQTAEDYKVFQKSVEETEESLDKISNTLAQVEVALKSEQIDPKVSKKLEEVREALVKERETFGRFSEFSKKTVSGLDVYLKADEIISNAQKRSGGPLARNLQVLATLMEEYSAKLPVPLVREALEFYGKVTTKLLDATDQINGTIKRNWEQGIIAIGSGTHNTADDERYQAFLRDFPEDAALGPLLAPQESAFVYQNEQFTGSPIRYVWDGEKWHKINNDKLNVHQALTDSVLAGDRADVQRLLHMSKNADFYNQRRKSALEIYKFIIALKRGVKLDPTYRQIFRSRLGSSDWISAAVKNPEEFLALYRCNEQFSIELKEALGKVYVDLKKVEDPRLKDLAKRIRYLESWAETANLELPKDSADGTGQLRARVINQADRTTVAGAMVVAQNRKTGKRYQKRSDSQGMALIKGLAAGDHRVGGRLKGYEDYMEAHWNIMETGFTEITIYLKPSPPKAQVAVSVFDQKTGQKITGARVSFTGPQNIHTRAAAGSVSIALPAGSWTVNADAYGYTGMVSSIWVNPAKQTVVKKKMMLPPSEVEKKKKPEETEMVFEAYEPDAFFTRTEESPTSPESEAQAELPEAPEMPGNLTNREIVKWRDETITRLRAEGNARLDKIRTELGKLEGQTLERGCSRCGHGGPHWWDGHGWTCVSCGATVMTVGEYPTAGGSYKKTRAHYLSLINQVRRQADAKLK